MPPMTGTFKLIKSENFDEYLESIGVDLPTRDIVVSAIPVTHITSDGDEWAINTVYSFITTGIKFKLGEEFDDTSFDGHSCKCVFTQEGNDKLVYVQKYSGGGLCLTIIREFTSTEMIMTMEGPQNVVSTRIFEKQKEEGHFTSAA